VNEFSTFKTVLSHVVGTKGRGKQFKNMTCVGFSSSELRLFILEDGDILNLHV